MGSRPTTVALTSGEAVSPTSFSRSCTRASIIFGLRSARGEWRRSACGTRHRPGFRNYGAGRGRCQAGLGCPVADGSTPVVDDVDVGAVVAGSIGRLHRDADEVGPEAARE